MHRTRRHLIRPPRNMHQIRESSIRSRSSKLRKTMRRVDRDTLRARLALTGRRERSRHRHRWDIAVQSWVIPRVSREQTPYSAAGTVNHGAGGISAAGRPLCIWWDSQEVCAAGGVVLRDWVGDARQSAGGGALGPVGSGLGFLDLGFVFGAAASYAEGYQEGCYGAEYGAWEESCGYGCCWECRAGS